MDQAQLQATALKLLGVDPSVVLNKEEIVDLFNTAELTLSRVEVALADDEVLDAVEELLKLTPLSVKISIQGKTVLESDTELQERQSRLLHRILEVGTKFDA